MVFIVWICSKVVRQITLKYLKNNLSPYLQFELIYVALKVISYHLATSLSFFHMFHIYWTNYFIIFFYHFVFALKQILWIFTLNSRILELFKRFSAIPVVLLRNSCWRAFSKLFLSVLYMVLIATLVISETISCIICSSSL